MMKRKIGGATCCKSCGSGSKPCACDEGWTKIGVCGVDSGQLIITDPSYIDSEWVKEGFKPGAKPKASFSYNGCCQKTLRSKGDGQLKFKAGHDGVGVVFSSGIGDGLYPVYARIAKVPGFGERIVEVRIDLMDHPMLREA